MKTTTYNVAPVVATVCDSLAPKQAKSLISLCDSCCDSCCDSLRQSKLSHCFYYATVVRQSATVGPAPYRAHALAREAAAGGLARLRRVNRMVRGAK